MRPHFSARRASRAFLILSLLTLTIFSSFQFPAVKALTFTTPQQVPTGTNLLTDPKLRFVDNAPSNNTALKRDPLVKFVDLNANGHWDVGEPVVYDQDNDSVYQSTEQAITGNISPGATLATDPLLKYVDINGNNRWDNGEAAIYDIGGLNKYIIGDPVIGGTPVPPGTSVTMDSHIKFIGPGPSWVQGNPIVYDSNNDGLYSISSDPHLRYVDANNNGHWDTGETVVNDTTLSGAFASTDRVIYGPTPPIGTLLKTDSKIKFVDSNNNGIWNLGEAVVYDSNGDNIYESNEPMIAGASPPTLSPLSSDLRIKFVDANNNTVWDPGETVVYDTINQGFFNATIDPKIQFFDQNGNGIFDPGIDSVVYNVLGLGFFKTPGDILIAGPLVPTDGSATLQPDNHFHFVDSNLSGHWSVGKTVVYDPDSDHVFITGDPVLTTNTPVPANGTFLTEPVLSGTRPSVGTRLRFDPKMKYFEIAASSFWKPGEAVVYDSNSNGLFDPCCDSLVLGMPPPTGALLSEPVIVGIPPANGTALKFDPNIRFIDTIGTGRWVPGETVIYDANADGLYERTESVLANGSPATGLWISGEDVLYDSNNNGLYNSGEPVVVGTAPLNLTKLASDPRIKYVDANNNGHWDPSETVAYDTNNNNVYDPGDLVIAGATPAPGIFLGPSSATDSQGRIWLSWNEKPIGTQLNPKIYFKVWNGTVWSSKQPVTTGSANDLDSFVAPLINQTMMILWSSNSTGHPQLFYRLYSSAGTNWNPTTGPIQLTSSALNDGSPTAIQDRNGRIWVAWARGTQTTKSQIYYKYFNGTAWSTDFPLPPASISSISQKSPSMVQTKDGKIRVVWSSNETSNLNLFYTTTNGTILTLPSAGIPSSAWSAKAGFPFSGSNDDDHPVIIQSRDGAYWIFFQRSILVPPAENIYYATATDPGGLSWSGATQMTTGQDSSPTAVQNSDHRIWTFWNSLVSSTVQILSSNSNPITGVNDLGVRGIFTSPSLVRSNYPVNITTLVTNYGDSIESTTLSLVANTTNNVLKTWSLTLTPGQSLPIYFNWTSAQPWGRYTLVASLTNISPTESFAANTGDDSLAIYPLRVSPPGDANGDGRINILDLALVAICYGQTPTWGTMCNPYVDVDNDGKPIGVLDLALVAINFNLSV